MKKVFVGKLGLGVLAFGFIVAGFLLVTQSTPTVVAASCTVPTSLVLPYAAQSDTGDVIFANNVRITGNVQTNADLAQGSGIGLRRITGDASAVGTISSGIDVVPPGVATESAPAVSLPAIDESQWEADAALGGTVGSQMLVGGSTGSPLTLGPVKIVGDLTIGGTGSDDTHVRIMGPVFVTGNILIRNGGTHINLDPSFGTNGTVIMGQNTIAVTDNVDFGDATSGFIVLVSSKPTYDPNSIQIDSNPGTSVVYYSMNGGVTFLSNAKELAVYGQNIQFCSN